MKNISYILLIMVFIYSPSVGQEKTDDIIFIVDELRTAWDIEAVKMESYNGMKEYCHSKAYRTSVSSLLNKIHHYDTTLYFTVAEKYDVAKDPAAKETLDDILTLETEYTNRKFVSFLKEECKKVISIEKNMAKKDSGGFDKDIEALEEELTQYIDAVTERVDLVDEHIHHLKALDPESIKPPANDQIEEDTGF